MMACSNKPEDPPYPEAMVNELLDAPKDSAAATMDRYYPGSHTGSGALAITQIEGSKTLREVILFADVRSGRVNSVVLKYRPDLDDKQFETVLAGFGATAVFDENGHATAAQGARKYRIRRRDKRGKPTVTIE